MRKQSRIRPKTCWPVVEIDHTCADVHLVDSCGAAGRLCLTVATDTSSRLIMGCLIGTNPPGFADASDALRKLFNRNSDVC